MIPFWPFGTKIETRSEGYSESLESLLVEQARGSTSASASKLAALEIALGLWGRAFASAEVTPGGPVADALSPSTLVYMAREMIRVGEAVFLIEIVTDG